MHEIPYSISEEAFLLSCVQEVIKVWSINGQAYMSISMKDGHAVVNLGFQLGYPKHAHVPSQQQVQPQFSKYKSPARKEKDRARAAAHHAKLQKSVPTSGIVTQMSTST